MTVVNPKSISGITSITTASGSDNLLTIHTSDANNTERLRIDSTGATKIVTGIVTTLTATGSAKVGSGVTLSPDGDIFATGITTIGTSGANDSNADGGQVEIGGTLTQFRVHAGSQVGMSTFVFGDTQVGSAATSIAHFDIANKNNTGLGISQDDDSNISYIVRRDNGGDIGFILRHETQNRERVRIMSSGRVGIGSTIPTTALDVNGVITGDGSGLTGINTPSFSAYVTGNPSISGNSSTTVVFNVEDHDTDGAYNNSTGVFTVPAGKAGKYHISAYGGIDDIDDGTYVRIVVLKNDALIPGFRAQSHCSVNQRIETTGVSGTATLAVGDEIKVQLFTNDGVSTGMVMENETCRFSMFRLSI